ncbi:HNH endonuclease [Gelidibacter salicanalis]|uniref:HNH endonuclease n=1 Tax=Gelidibacter salicanalis TaxID=291193 RepID=A0A934KXQ9_9FLAO|nr:HNH endonuclease [Gelidibacter salicanalis]MBJ7882248.1 HNH endonuclease [Gelidibacter salicanalis]
MTNNNWSREETIVAFNVYCKIPFKNSSKTHPTVIKYAHIIGRSPSALNMKIGNFGRLDPELKKRGISGLVNGSKLEEIVWNEFHGNWDDLAFESEKIIAEFQGNSIEGIINIEDFPEGKDKLRLVKTRVNQSFFRSSVLSAYNLTCCITGLKIPELLIASHIIPWRDDKERTNPQNGVCLNSLHDKAFDKGLLSISPDYTIAISRYILDYEMKEDKLYFSHFNNKKMSLPDKFFPKREFLEHHYSNYIKNGYN